MHIQNVQMHLSLDVYLSPICVFVFLFKRVRVEESFFFRALKGSHLGSFMGSMYTTTGWKASIRNFVLPYALPYALSKTLVSPLKEGD